MPKRIQRQRSKGWRMPEGAISVTRPGPFGNPFSLERAMDHMQFVHGVPIYRPDAPATAVNLFRDWITGGIPENKSPVGETFRQKYLARIPELRGKDLACWCSLSSPCHADVLLELANA